MLGVLMGDCEDRRDACMRKRGVMNGFVCDIRAGVTARGGADHWARASVLLGGLEPTAACGRSCALATRPDMEQIAESAATCSPREDLCACVHVWVCACECCVF